MSWLFGSLAHEEKGALSEKTEVSPLLPSCGVSQPNNPEFIRATLLLFCKRSPRTS